MEHRCTQRVSVRLTVKVSEQGRCLGIYQSRDMSLFGVYLERGPVFLPLYRTLDLTISVNKGKCAKHEVSAIVVRRGIDGVGLTFVRDGHPQNINLSDILSTVSLPRRSKAVAGLTSLTPDL